MSVGNSTLVFNVRRNEPELVPPARPTPIEIKRISDADDLHRLRLQPSVILVYEATKERKDPAKVIKAALGEALVYYYPWAGRLRVGPHERLVVDCTAEGVVFVEADAEVRLDQFGEESMVTPFPCVDQFFYNRASHTFSVVDCPLFTIQVTRLLCGGFIVAFNFSHVMSDAIGIVLFLNAITELGRGASAPSILPVWRRELLTARNPPRVTCPLPDDIDHQHYTPKVSQDDLVNRTFIFVASELASLRAWVPHHLQPCTTFELISASLWYCRTIALRYQPQEEVSIEFAVNIRNIFNPPLPVGYYGNACAIATSVSLAGEICNNSFGYTVELVKKAKSEVTEESMKSLVDQASLSGQRLPTMRNTYIISDVSSTIHGFPALDFGWGKPVFAGPPDNGRFPHLSFILPYGNGKGKVVSLSLPADAMDRFVIELGNLLKMELVD